MSTEEADARLTAVVRKTDRELKRYLRARIGNGAEAEDLAQEVYLRYLRIGRSEVIRSPEAYLFRIAGNAASEWRMRARNRLPHSQDCLDDMPCDDDAAEAIWRAQLAAELTVALDRLPANYRAAVLLHRRHDLTCQEVGTRLGLSTETVRKYLVRAVALCREHLQRRLGPGSKP
jgi:RNA polymerase sigma-70 factor (ECF subfamily)